jgi:molybdopterin/thiamine biosynthesis adenylyltransferase
MTTNDPQQQQMIRDAMKSIAERKPGRTKLVYDKAKRTIVAVAEGSQVPRALNITADDADMFGVITLSGDWLREAWPRLNRGSDVAARFTSWDDGDAYTLCDLGPLVGPMTAECAIGLDGNRASDEPGLRIILSKDNSAPARGACTFVAPDGSKFLLKGYDHRDGRVVPLAVTVVEVQPALSERRAGLLESTVLNDRSIVCFGLGTGGAYAAIELAKCGVRRFALVDPDRLSVGNVVRHPGGISQVGRYKVNVIRDAILEKNPDALVSVYPVAVSPENLEDIRSLIRGANLVICGTDNRPSKLLINQLCIEESVAAVYGGAFRRAYGGQVLRVRPRVSPCQQCFISAMPDEAADVEISSPTEADAVAYSDRPVAVEPGLSLDVLPIANFLTKLALIELLEGKSTSLDILRRDFSAPWYLWLNRPEPGTDYSSMPPLSDSTDEMTINRWYGIEFERDAACPACGDFLVSVAAAHGIDLDAIVLPSKAE